MIRTWIYTLAALAFLALAMALLLSSRPAAAQQFCAPVAEMLKVWRERLAEFEILRGQTEGGEFIVTRSQSGKWTIILVRQGIGCVMAGGSASVVDKGV